VNSGSIFRAVMWNGTAQSMVDLQSDYELPGFTNSMAELIDSQGNILGSMFNDTQHRHLVMWQVVAVPEPGAVGLMAMVVMIVGTRRGRFILGRG